jgi:hypothetical protein
MHHETSGDLDAEMKGDELGPTHILFISPPAFNTRRKRKERKRQSKQSQMLSQPCVPLKVPAVCACDVTVLPAHKKHHPLSQD